MSKANCAVRKTIIALTALAVLATAAYAAEPKFRAAPGSEPVIGHYLVRLDDSIVDSAVRGSAEGLARTYGGQLEIYASSDVRQFAVVMLPARARTLSADPRVREVVGIAQGDDAFTPPPAAAPPLSRHLVPAALDSSSSGTYLYDGSGNIKSIGSDSFYYDVDGRLAKATVLGNQQTFTYDPLGNRLTAARATGAVGCVGGCDIAVTVNQQNNHVSGFTYDEAGNVTNANGPSYTFDGTGMVTRAVVASDIRDFLYTVDDERIAVRKGTSWTWSVRDLSGKVLREFTSLETSSPFGLSAHTWSKDYIWRDGQLLASVFPTTEGTISPRTTYHYHLDHLGTPRLVTDGNHILVGKHAYYAFGAEMDLTPKEPATERMKFTGHERDIVAGDGNSVDYMHARYYNSTVGRFLSLDPVLGGLRTPQSWNRYAYVMNNPMNRTDPTGKYTCDGSKANCDVVNKMIAFLPQAAAQLNKNDPHRQQLLAVSKAFGKLGDTKSKIGVVTVNPVDAKGRQQLPPGTYGAPTTTGVAISFLNIGARAQGNNQLAIEMVGGNLTHEGTHKLQNLSFPIASRAEHVEQEHQAYSAEAGWYAGTHFNAPNGTWTGFGGYNEAAINSAAAASTAAACANGCPP